MPGTTAIQQNHLLQRMGAINYSRGHITVLDRPYLEKLCCEGNAVIKQESDRLLPYLHRTNFHTANT